MAALSRIEKHVHDVFDAFRDNDAGRFVALLHPDFRFTSPYDDAIDSDAFMERCWPGNHQLTRHKLKQVVTDGETAFVHYELATVAGNTFQNVERFVFRDDLLFSVDVFFGDPPAGHGRWKSEDIQPAAAVRKLIEDRYQAIREKDGEATMAAVSDVALMFDVVDPLCHTDASGMRHRMEDWFDSFEEPVSVELKDLVVSADGDTAFAYSLNRYKGTFKSGGSTDMWVRHTSCYRLKEVGWQLVHEHLSVPFDRHTGKWSLDLEPSLPNRAEAASIESVYGQLSCSDITTSEDWFAKLFGRSPDDRPMAGLTEWHHRGVAGLQLYENKENAGHGTLTLIVGDLRSEHTRLDRAGLRPGPIEPATTTSLVQLRDPDGNLVVLAQPGRA